MQKSPRSPLTGKDVAGAGMFLLSANLLFAAVGAGIGALFGAALALAGSLSAVLRALTQYAWKLRA